MHKDSLRRLASTLPSRKPQTRYVLVIDGRVLEAIAHTKSEARAVFKRQLGGPIPHGAEILTQSTEAA